MIEHFEKLKNLEQQKKEDNIIELKDKKKFKKKPFRKKKFLKKLNNSFFGDEGFPLKFFQFFLKDKIVFQQ